MPFYQGGMRFASRTVSAPQPSTSQAESSTEREPASQALHDPYGHPLKQNGLPSSSNYHRSSPREMPVNPSSYAARAQPRPDLYVATSSMYPAPQGADMVSPVSPISSEQVASPSINDQAYRRSRKGSVPDRSPLQKLEVTLGDISKEEKRARVQEAENLVAQNPSGNRRESYRSNGREITRKPLPSDTAHAERSAIRNSTRAGATYPVRSMSQRDGGVYFPHRHATVTRDRRLGYDASLTGGAAAAAVGAYQSPSDARPIIFNQTQDNRYALASNSRVNERAEATASPQAQMSTRSPSMMQATAPEQSQAPQAHSGQRASKILGPEAPKNSSQPAQGSGSRLRFSNLVHRDRSPDRRYQPFQQLDEWKYAEKAILSARDQDLDAMTTGSQPWWEKDSEQRRQVPASMNVSNVRNRGPEADISQTTFQPPLMLRCGPLLRYTGIRQVASESTGTTDRAFWRGSVMIVTRDAESSYRSPPALRLFKQPLTPQQKSAEHGHLHDNNSASEDDESDAVAGQTKCAPGGKTIFVKPVGRLPGGDLSNSADNEGLFEPEPSPYHAQKYQSRLHEQDGEKIGLLREVKGHRLHTERGLTFWRFNIEVELTDKETRVAYRINQGPAISFWTPSVEQSMNIMFYSCNGFGLNVDASEFSGPDPLWRDVLNAHEKQPFHVMIGGGDQLYNDCVMDQTTLFADWLGIEDPQEKDAHEFNEELQNELESFYLNRYADWYSKGLFGLANAQIPMVNVWDDHDIIDGYGSYPHHTMHSPVFTGLGHVAFKYYMLFQHQSLTNETPEFEPSWLLGASTGPYIRELSRHLLLPMGRDVTFVGLDCRTERTEDEILSEGTYNKIFNRLREEAERSRIKHLIVLLGVPIAYPRMNTIDSLVRSRAIDPIRWLGHTERFESLFNKFNGGVQLLDDLSDHWTAKKHKAERTWLIHELQDFAAQYSVRITILGGDVHLAAVGQFHSAKSLGIPKDRDHRYMPNVVSSAIVNTPPPDMLADVLNRGSNVHHLDPQTDEDMIPLFIEDVNGKKRNNRRLLPRRNYCIIRPYQGEITPPPSPTSTELGPTSRGRSFSFRRRSSSAEGRSRSGSRSGSILRRFTNRGGAPPSSFRDPKDQGDNRHPYSSSGLDTRVDGPDEKRWRSSDDAAVSEDDTIQRPGLPRSNSFQRRPSSANEKSWARDSSGREGHIDLEGGLDITLNCELEKGNPAGHTVPYRMIVPALFGRAEENSNLNSELDVAAEKPSLSSRLGFGSLLQRRRRSPPSTGTNDVGDMATGFSSDQQHPNQPIPGQRDLSNDDFQDARETSLSPNGRYGATAPLPSESPENARVDYSAGGDENADRSLYDNLPRAAGSVETDVPFNRSRSSERRFPSTEQIASRTESLTNHSRSLKEKDRPPPIHTLHQDFTGSQHSTKFDKFSGTARNRQYQQYRKPQMQESKQAHRAPPITSSGLDAPLGRVNNRISVQPTNVPWNAADAPWRRNQESQAAASSRSVSGPAELESKSTHRSRPNTDVSSHADTRRSSATKDPYAHLYPEAVEANWNSEDEEDVEAENISRLSEGVDSLSPNMPTSNRNSGYNDVHAPPQQTEQRPTTSGRYYARHEESDTPGVSREVSPVPPMPRKSSQRDKSRSTSRDAQPRGGSFSSSSKAARHFGGFDGGTGAPAAMNGDGVSDERPGTIGMPSVSGPRPMGQTGMSEKAARKLGVSVAGDYPEENDRIRAAQNGNADSDKADLSALGMEYDVPIKGSDTKFGSLMKKLGTRSGEGEDENGVTNGDGGGRKLSKKQRRFSWK
ncbi:MAG: hypothetical protein M1831_007440 [Alyxoria varia]|nr:MAG: hypothetical protein M1831_007440 [Alyxoria varia]